VIFGPALGISSKGAFHGVFGGKGEKTKKGKQDGNQASFWDG